MESTEAVFEKEPQAIMPNLIRADFELKQKYLRTPASEEAEAKMSEEENAILKEAGFKGWGGYDPPHVKVHDARALQATFDSPATMFRTHGFCLLQHKTAVNEWNDNFMIPKSEITEIYHAECKELLDNHLFPEDKDKILEAQQPNAVLARGPGTKINFYAASVHQDFGVNIEEFVDNVKAFAGPAYAKQYKDKWDKPEVTG